MAIPNGIVIPNFSCLFNLFYQNSHIQGSFLMYRISSSLELQAMVSSASHILTVFFNYCIETPLIDYERLRAQNMMENNQMFQRLGLSTLASMINNTSSKSKDDVSRQSGSLYDAQDSEGSEQEEVSKVHILLCITMFVL